MSIFNQMLRGYGSSEASMEKVGGSLPYKPRTFTETLDDQIAFHKSKIADLEAVRNSLSPEILKFIEAMQKLG